MHGKNSLKKVNRVARILRERGILEHPIIEITSGKGPIMEGLIPILVRGPGGPQGESHSEIRSSPLFVS